MMYDRVQATNPLLSDNSIVCYTIDDFELSNLSIILELNFGGSNKLANVLIRHNLSGR